MFYAQFVLSKKGPLAQIWLAAHWEKKLSKAQIYETNVQDAVAEIIQPKVRLSLRTTGHLLIGIVRIYSRKAKYVLADCNEAFMKLKMAFKHGGANDLALKDREKSTNNNNDTAEIVTDFYDNLPEINDFDMGPLKEYQANQSHIDEITIKEDRFANLNNRGFAGGLDFVADVDGEGIDDFGEKQLDNRGRSQSMFNEIEQEVELHRRQTSSPAIPPSPGLFREDGIQKDPEGGLVGTAEELDSLFETVNDEDFPHAINQPATPLFADMSEKDLQMEVDQQQHQQIPANELSFQLDPIEQLPHQERIRQKRKRKLIIDEQKNISGEEMKANMADYSDTLQPLDLAPPTKQLMRLKESCQLEKMLMMPACKEWMLDPRIIQLYQSHLELHALDSDDLIDELHRDLDMVASIEEDEIGRFEQEEPPYTPLHDNIENVVPEPEAEVLLTPERVPSPIVPEKRSAKRSRAHEKDEEEVEEEEFFTRRTKNILLAINTKIRSSEDNKIVFEDLLTKGSTRRTAAQKFYALLELKKRQAIEIEQAEPYGPIEITPGPRMQETIKVQV